MALTHFNKGEKAMKLLIAVFIFACCGQLTEASESRLNVVATIQTLADLAREVGGDKVNVVSLSKGYMDPHFVEPKPSLVLDLHKADLLIHVGLELEIGWLPPLILGSRNAKIRQGGDGNFQSSTVIHILKVPTIRVDRSMGDIHPQGNPHFWIPPKNALAIAKGISDRLKKLQPENKAYFDTLLEQFTQKMAALEKKIEPQIKKLNGMKVVPYHDSWAYVTDWLKLSEQGFVEIKPGVPPDPAHLVDLINQMKQDHVKVILKETFYNNDIAKTVAEKAGAKVLEMPSDVGATSDIKTYEDLVNKVISKISGAL